MGSKDKKKTKEEEPEQCAEQCSDEDCDGCDYDGQDSIDVAEKIESKIKELPTLKEKVQIIAINSYLIEKRLLDKKMNQEIEAVQLKFRETFNPQISQINAIVDGTHVYSDADFQEIDDLLTPQELATKHNYLTNQKIPEFWLKAFRNSDVIGQQIQARDQPILRHLQKIQAGKTQDLKKLWVDFYFSENEWFTNTKLHKQFQIDGEDIKKSSGDQINWKDGKNITVKIVKKKNKKKGGQKKTKEVKQQSFFNFFKDVEIDSDEDQDGQNDNTEDVQDLELQYETAEILYEEVIPKSLEYYLGVIETFDDGELEDIDEEDEEEEEQAPKQKGKGKNKKD